MSLVAIKEIPRSHALRGNAAGTRRVPHRKRGAKFIPTQTRGNEKQTA